MLNRLIARSRRSGLRARLAVAIGAIVVAAAAATFAVTYQGTGSRVRDQIERDLSAGADSLQAQLAAQGLESHPMTLRRARRSIAAEPAFGPSSRLIVIDVPGAGVATNEPELLGLPGANTSEESPADRRREADEAELIRDAPIGRSTVHLEDAGDVLLLKRSLAPDGPRGATITVGQPLAPVDNAQTGVARTFLIAGSLTVAVALLVAFAVASRIAAPLRRMATAASAVDAGDLSHHIPEGGAREVQQLAESFNHMLDRLDDAFARQREFVSDASHELRTPLTAIQGQIEVLGRSGSPSEEEIDATVAEVNREVARLDRLVDDLTLLASSEESIAYRTTSVDLEPFIADTVGSLARAGSSVEVGTVPSGRVMADGDRIAQVLRNLVQNALQHGGPGGVVRVSATARGDRIRVAVDDDGPGIPPAERERVFDRFHRTDLSRTRRSGGSGLGLAIARAIVQAHGGRIWAEISPQGGARIAFELPGFDAS